MAMKTGTNVFHSSLMGTMDILYIVNRFKLDPIAGGATEQIELKLSATKGALASVKCQCQSANYDLYLYPHPNVDIESIMVTYAKLGINKVSIAEGLQAFWAKYSQYELQAGSKVNFDQTIYAYINNKGANTGDIYLELTYQVLQ